MLPISQADRATHKDVANDSMQDTCVLFTLDAGSANRYGKASESESAGSEMQCGFSWMNSDEAKGNTEVSEADAEIRLPLTASLDNLDRIRVTKLQGTALGTPYVFEVIGEPQRGPTAFVLECKLATDTQAAKT